MAKEFPYSLNDLKSWKIGIIKVEWVWLTVRNVKWDLLLVLENENKAWKKAWQRSTVMETIENTDNCVIDAVKRWLNEELGVALDKWEKIWPENSIIQFYVYDSKSDKVYQIYLYLYDVILSDFQVKQALNFTNWEVGKVKLVSLQDIKKDKIVPLRPWTKEVLFWNSEGPYFVVDGEIVSEKK